MMSTHTGHSRTTGIPAGGQWSSHVHRSTGKDARGTILRMIILTLAMVVFTRAQADNPSPPSDQGHSLSFPSLATTLALTGEFEFLSSFVSLLESLPVDQLPALHAAIDSGTRDKSLDARHGYRALQLTDCHWATADPNGFLKVARAARRDVPPPVMLAALQAWIPRDRDAALTEFRTYARRFGPGQLLSGPFLGWLAESDPASAFVELQALLKEPQQFPQIGTRLFAVWAKTDPSAAWQALGQLPPRSEFVPLRANVLATVAAKDESIALAMVEDLPRAADPDSVLGMWIHNMTKDAPDRGLALARRVNSVPAWTAYAGTARRGDDAATLRHLLEVVPAAMQEPSLGRFFRIGMYDSTGTARRLPLLAALPDPALREALESKIIGDGMAAYGRPLSRAVCDLVLLQAPAKVLDDLKNHRQYEFLHSLLAVNPLRGLDWLLQLDETRWKQVSSGIASHWPQSQLAANAASLFKSANSREVAVGRQLAIAWYGQDPAAAFALWHYRHPAWLADQDQVELLAEKCAGEKGKAEALLATLPNGNREKALALLRAYTARLSPPLDPAELLASIRKGGAPDEAAGVITPMLDRELPGIDATLTALPGDTPGLDKLWLARGKHHLIMGRQDQAMECWKNMKDAEAMWEGLGLWGNFNKHVTDWPAMIRFLLATPVTPDPCDLLENSCANFAASDRKAAYALVRYLPDPIVREYLLLPMARGTRTPEQLKDLQEHAKYWPVDCERREFDAWVREARVRVDPKQAWQHAASQDTVNEDVRELACLAITRICEDDPESVPSLLLKAKHLAMNQSITNTVLNILSRKDPVAAFHAAATGMFGDSAHRFNEAAAIWARRDPDAAATASFTLKEPAASREAIDTVLRVWVEADADAALTWLKADPARAGWMPRYISCLANYYPARATTLLSALPVDRRTMEIAGKIAYDHLLRVDCAAAAALLRDSAIAAHAASVPVEQGSNPYMPLCNAWKPVITQWAKSDPPASNAFIDALPHSPAITMLVHGSFDTPSANWSARAIIDLAGNIPPGMTFAAMTRANGITAALQALPPPGDNFAREYAANGILDHALRARDAAGVHEIFTTLDGEDALSRSMAHNVARHLANHQPDALFPWLQSLENHPDRLIHALRSTVEIAMDDKQVRLAVLETLLRLPTHGNDGKPASWLVKFAPVVHAGPEASEVSLDPVTPGTSIVATLDQITAALANGNPAAALPAAATLPSPEFDALLVRILLAIPLDHRAAAINAAPATVHPRVQAMARCCGER